MRVMIAGADNKAVTGLAIYLNECGHHAEITSNGLECKAVLRGFIPDLIVLEFNIYWVGCDSVLAAMKAVAKLKNVPVVLYTVDFEQVELADYPRIIASLSHPLQPGELNRLKKRLENINATRITNSNQSRKNGQSSGNGKARVSLKSAHGYFRHVALAERPILPTSADEILFI